MSVKYEFDKEYFNFSTSTIWIYIEPKCFGETQREDLEIDLRELPSEITTVIIQSEVDLAMFPCNDVFIIGDNKLVSINTSNCRYTIRGNNNRINVWHENNVNLDGINNCLQCDDSGHYYVEGSANRIKARGSTVVNVYRGSRNVIEAFNYSWVKINRGVKETCIKILDYSTIINEDSSSSIYCFDSSVCRTAPNTSIRTFGNKSVVFEMVNVLGKDACVEPVDENSGYFYKAVRKDMRPMLYNLGKNENFKYEVGKEFICEDFNEKPVVCATGFHFFATVEEAIYFASSAQEDFIILRLLVNFDDIAETNNGKEIAEKFRARKVFVDSIVPEEQYKDFLDIFMT